LKHIAKQVYQRAGFSEEHATQLANLFEVVLDINTRLKREGKKDLLERLREKRIREAQEGKINA
jgi:hypothetical protein